MTTDELAAITAVQETLEVMEGMLKLTREHKQPFTQEHIGALVLAMGMELNRVAQAQPHLPSSSSEAA